MFPAPFLPWHQTVHRDRGLVATSRRRLSLARPETRAYPLLFRRVAFSGCSSSGMARGTRLLGNKKAAFTSTPRGGRVLIRITRVRLLRGGVLSVVGPFRKAGERARARQKILIVKAPNTAMPNLEFLSYSCAYIREPLGETCRVVCLLAKGASSRWRAARRARRAEGRAAARRGWVEGVNRTK